MSDGKPVGAKELTPQDRTALSEVYRALWSEVSGFVRKRFGSGPPDPEEVTQAAFERLVRAHQADAFIVNPRAYLLAVATNLVRDHYRQATVRSAVHRDMALRNSGLEVSDLTPERVLITVQRLDVLKAALARMPEVRRRVFLLIRVEGLSVAEVAERFCMSEATIYKHVSRAMQDCLAALKAAEDSDGSVG